MTSVVLPIKTVNTSNGREHWRKVAARAKAHRSGTYAAIGATWRRLGLGPELDALDRGGGLVVTLTRIAPRALDDDGNVTSLKAVRDGVADAFGLPSDRDPRVSWRYAQARAGVREYAVRVDIEERVSGECPTCGALCLTGVAS